MNTRPLAILAGAGLLLSAPSLLADDETNMRQLIRDCRTEGRAADLRGDELSRYVEECVKDFIETEITNNVTIPKARSQR